LYHLGEALAIRQMLGASRPSDFVGDIDSPGAVSIPK